VYGVDVSNFSNGPLDLEQARLIRDSNRRLIVGCQDVAVASQQVEFAMKADLDVQLYIYFYTGVPIMREIQKALEVIRRTGLERPMVWMDFEDTSTDDTLSRDVGWIERTMFRCGQEFGVGRIGIYTSRGWWERYTGNNTEYSIFPLWDANWDNQADLTAFTPYGGWTAPTMKQYAGDRDLWGMKVDFNVYAGL
jgi:hypothetical protein